MGLSLSVSALILLCVLAAFAALLRWSFGSDLPAQPSLAHPARRRKARPGDYGLLREIAIVPSIQAAQFVRDQLRGKGIRSTLAPTDDGGHRILVFPADVDDATTTLLHEGDPD